MQQRVMQPVSEVVLGMVGKKCWSAAAGLNGDYPFVIDFGEKVRRRLRLANPGLNFLQRTYEGEFSLTVVCPWRLDGPKEVIVSCYSGREPRDLVSEALRYLEGQEVVEVRCEAPGYDLHIYFDQGLVLRCFPLETFPQPPLVPRGERPPPPPRAPRNNWALATPDGEVVIGPKSDLHEPPSGPNSDGPRLTVVKDDT